MHFSMTTATPEQIFQRCTNTGNKSWDLYPEFQRDLVWNLEQKKYLIDSMKKRLPFGMVTVVNYDGKTFVIDGKQRTTTIVSFMKNEFEDSDKHLYKNWSATDKARCMCTPIAVQEVELEEHEGWIDIIELFRRINTVSKQLTTGQLLWSSKEQDTIKFMLRVFKNEVEANDPLKNKINEVRDRWKSIFCKGEFNIKNIEKTKGELTFLAGLVIPLLTDHNAAITTSFQILFDNGLKEKINDNMIQKFFKKITLFLNIADKGYEKGYFTKLARGYPTYGEISAILYLINIKFNNNNHQFIDYLNGSNNLETFFEKWSNNQNFQIDWKTQQRKNRNISNLNNDIIFMQQALD